MTNVDSGRRRNRVPPLAIIVLALLALLAAIAMFRSNGSVKSPDSEVSMPVDLPDEAVMPNPQPNAPPVPRPG